ncbi:hypothetical protein BH11PSE11_BH11PSE11_35680 [soil metagenome]
MLSITYSIAVLTAEQKKTRAMFDRLQHRSDAGSGSCKRESGIDEWQTTVGLLSQFEQHCRARRFAMHFIPVLRHASARTAQVLAEHEALSAKIAGTLGSVHSFLALNGGMPSKRSTKLPAAIKRCLKLMEERLEMEEQQILAIVLELLPPADWFPIAATFLSIDTQARRNGAWHLSA